MFRSLPEGVRLGYRLAENFTISIVRMPGMDGLELQRHLVASGWKVPIIFISAHADEQVRADAMQAGAVEFFEKPFSSPALLKAIRAASASLAAGPPGK